MSQVRATVYYDFVDPISYLLALEIATLPEPLKGSIEWCPFELRPPPTPLVTLDDPAIAGRWERVREEEDIDVAPPSLVPWTRKAHELVLHAAKHDAVDLVRRSVFRAYVEEGADIGRVDVLVGLAVESGLDRTETKAVLDVDRHEAEVAALRAGAVAAGVTEIPTLVAGGERLEGFHIRGRIGTLLGT